MAAWEHAQALSNNRQNVTGGASFLEVLVVEWKVSRDNGEFHSVFGCEGGGGAQQAGVDRGFAKRSGYGDNFDGHENYGDLMYWSACILLRLNPGSQSAGVSSRNVSPLVLRLSWGRLSRVGLAWDTRTARLGCQQLQSQLLLQDRETAEELKSSVVNRFNPKAMSPERKNFSEVQSSVVTTWIHEVKNSQSS
jgi:hypothetical protein